ncbi:MAG TPA: hypothetical protein VNM92_02855 [Thermoanaerobaculia bacterium]|nr:hypothetical protein [Thermoanaerobaculia bacterium]
MVLIEDGGGAGEGPSPGAGAPPSPAGRGGDRAAPLLLLVAMIAIALSLVFTSRFLLVQLLLARVGVAWLLAIAECLAIIGLTTVLRRLVDRSWPRSESTLAVDFLVGYPIFGTLCFLIATVGVNRWMLLAVIVVLAVPGVQRVREANRARRSLSVNLTPGTVVAFAILATSFALTLLAAQLPPATLDELAYHLTIPKAWVLEGRAVELPLLSHSWFPLGIESADLPALALLGDAGSFTSHLLHMIAAIATALTAGRWLIARTDSRLAIAATAALVTTPALLATAGWSLNDWTLLGISIALLTALAHSPRESARVSDIALPLAAGLLCKYTFVPLAAALIASRLFALPISRSLARSLLFGLAIGSVFFIRNLVLTGNPVAPFFAADAPAVSGFRDAGDPVRTLVGYIFDGAWVDESLGIAVILLAAVSILIWTRLDERHRFLRVTGTALGILSVVVIVSSAPSSRILVPFLFLLSMIGVVALDRLAIPAGRFARPLITTFLLTAASLQLFLSAYYIDTLHPFSTLSGRRSDAELVAAQRRAQPAIHWLDTRLPEDSRTLVVGINELFWFSHKVRGGGNFDGPRMSTYLSARAPGELSRKLRGDGISHVALFVPGINGAANVGNDTKRAERSTTLGPAAVAALQSLMTNDAVLIGRRADVLLYELKNGPNSAEP